MQQSSLIVRREPHVVELVEMMDRRLVEKGGVASKVFESLSTEDFQVIEEELRRVSGTSAQSVRYYLENYHVINAAAEDEPLKLKTFYPFLDAQEILWDDFAYCRENHIPVWWILLKCRQIGWSTLVEGILFQSTIFNRFVNSLVMADEKERSAWLLQMCKLGFDFLPYWMRPEIQHDVKGKHIRFDRKDQEERQRNPGLRSTIYCDAANKLSGVGRGMTFHCVHASEISNYIKPAVLTSDIMPAARRVQQHPLSMFVMEGTAKGRNYFFSDFWKSVQAGKYEFFRLVFCAWWKERTYFTPFSTADQSENFKMTTEERQLSEKVHDEFDYEIVPEQWNFYRQTRQIMADSGKDPDEFEHEYPTYPEAAFRSAGKSFFPKNSLLEIERRDVRNPVLFGDLVQIVTPPQSPQGEPTRSLTFRRFVDREDSPLWLWELPQKHAVYYLGADPGYGIQDRDFSVASVWKIPMRAGEEYHQVAEFRSWIEPHGFARMVANLGEFYNWCEVAPEMRPITTVIDQLQHAIKYPKIYRYRRYDRLQPLTRYLGWETNMKTRPIMMDNFKAQILRGVLHIKSKRLLDECFGFVDSIDKPGHFEGEEHDDCLFAAMIAITGMLDFDPRLALETMDEPRRNPATNSEGRDWHNSDYSPIYDDQNSAQYTNYDEL